LNFSLNVTTYLDSFILIKSFPFLQPSERKIHKYYCSKK